MKRLLFVCLLATILFTSCYGEPQSVHKTTNSDYAVELLFEIDGCKVYRFRDSGYKYFSTCQGSISWQESCGKNCVKDVEITTSNK
jgi:hypothetical protein